jgi:DNA-binding NarL/FixJ family response regulator
MATRARTRALHRDSHGIPLYVRALAGDGGVEAALLADLDPLSPGARRAVSAAAVLGGELEPGIVAAVADLPETTRYTVFDELCRHDLVRPVPGTGRFGFRHPLLCDAVYQSTEPGWRLAAHASAAQLLAARHAPAYALAPHLARVAVPGNTDAAAVLTEAAAAIRGRAPQTAVEWLDTAVRLLPGAEGGQDSRADLLLERALTLGAAGRGPEARETVHAAIALLRPELPTRRLRAITFCAQLERQLAHRDEGPALLRRELESLGSGQSGYGAALMAELAGNELVDGRLAEARTWAAQALPAARRHGARQVEAAGHGVLAMAHCLAGEVPRASAELAHAAALLDGLLDGELAAQRDAAIWIGWTEIMLGRPWDALRHLDRALAVGRSAGPQLGIAHLMVARAVALTAVGRVGDASECAEELADLADAADAGTLHVVAAAAGGWVGLWAGEQPGRAVPGGVRQAGGPAGSDALGWFGVLARGMRAETLLAGGDPAGCTALLLAEGRRLPSVDAWSQVRWCELLTRAALTEGRTDAAREWAARAAAAAAPLALPGLNGIALLARAQVQAIAEPAIAAVTADVAAEEFTSGGMLTDARRATVVAATARAACGEIDAARADLAIAQEAFEQGGALRLARETAKLRTRVASRARPIGGPVATDLLTARERQVAALVAEGASNREIARKLDVKEKTVEMHVSRVFVKLGVVNRVGVARAFGLTFRDVR